MCTALLFVTLATLLVGSLDKHAKLTGLPPASITEGVEIIHPVFYELRHKDVMQCFFIDVQGVNLTLKSNVCGANCTAGARIHHSKRGI